MACHKPPVELMRFMAKTGFITHRLWREHFFPSHSASWARRMKRDLIRRGYLKDHPSKYHRHVLLLNEKSDALRTIAPNPVAPPPMAQLEHDEILMEAVLKLQKSELMDYWQTEAELKKLGVSDYRIETQGQLIKYPDLLIFTRPPLPECIVAVELERTLKARRRYIQVHGAYAAMKRINVLLYVVENPSIERTIRETMTETYFPTSRLPVVFVSEDEWIQDPSAILTKAALVAPNQQKNAA
jgi:hypothetical protein